MKTKNFNILIGFGVLCAGLVWAWVSWTLFDIHGRAARENVKLITECEANLPRNQKCVIVKSAVVQKNE